MKQHLKLVSPNKTKTTRNKRTLTIDDVVQIIYQNALEELDEEEQGTEFQLVFDFWEQRK